MIAPAGFMQEATSENLMMGVAMTRRATFMYGKRLPRTAEGMVDNGLGKAVAFGHMGILPPTPTDQRQRTDAGRRWRTLCFLQHARSPRPRRR